MKKAFAVLICVSILFSFAACNNNVLFTETANQTVVAKDGTEYIFVGNEWIVVCFGEWEFIGHIKGEIKTFTHLSLPIKTGMYSVNGKQDVLVRYFPNNEFSAIYVRSDLLKTEITLDNCIRFELVEGLLYDSETPFPQNGITECEQFLSEIKSGQTAEDAGLYDLVLQPDGFLENCYTYGYVCGIVQEDLNIAIPLKVTSFDDKAYSIRIDNIEYVLPIEWLNKLIAE